MKTRIVLLLGLVLALGSSPSMQAVIIYDTGFANGGVVPDYTTAPGAWSDTRTVSSFDPGFIIQNVNVTLNLSGGYNGDLYVTLRYAPSGGGEGFAVLLNRIGRTSDNSFGYSGPGLNVTFSDSGSDIHSAGNSFLTGTYSPDARAADPATVLNTDSRSTFLSSFNGLNANGDWSLFIADMNGVDQSQVVSWGLDVSAVPEPTNVALGVFGGVVAAAVGLRAWRKSRVKTP